MAKTKAEGRKPSRAQERSEAIWKEIAENLIERLTEKDLQWSSGWTRTDSPVNLTTGNGYKGINNLMLRYIMWHRDTEDPRFCGFEQAKAKGWSVKKGSEGIPLRRYIETLRGADGKPVAGQGKMTPAQKRDYVESHPGSRITGSFKYLYVFSALDIDGIEPYKPSPRKEIDGRTVDALVEASPCKVVEVCDMVPCYSRSADKIMIPERGQFRDLSSLAKTLLHEQVHATGHESRLNRPVHEAWGDETYAREELVAELGSALAFSELGLVYPAITDGFTDDVKDNTAAYLADWAGALENPVDEIRSAFADAARGAALICDRNEELARTAGERGRNLDAERGAEAPASPGARLADVARQAREGSEAVRGPVPAGIAPDGREEL